jgi:hypothetical protein
MKLYLDRGKILTTFLPMPSGDCASCGFTRFDQAAQRIPQQNFSGA